MTSTSDLLCILFGLAIIANCYTVLAWQQRIIQIVPDIPDHRYQENCTAKECYNTSSFMQIVVRGSNLKIEFLPGTHIINISGIFKNNAAINNFALSATNLFVGATILCKGKFGFSFSKVTNLIISGLTFEYCGGVTSLGSFNIPWYCALYVGNSENISITEVTIRYGRGEGMYVEGPRGNFTLLKANLTFNGRNFFFATKSCACTNANDLHLNVYIAESAFTHSKNLGIIYGGGIKLQLLHKEFNVALHITNIFVDYNGERNLYIEYNVCKTMLNITNVFTSNSKTGLLLVTKASLVKCNKISKWTTAWIKKTMLVNTRLSLANEGIPTLPLQGGVKYRIIFSDIHIHGGDGPSTFFNVHGVILHNVTFEKTGGIIVENVTMKLAGQFLYKRNHFAIVIYTVTEQSTSGTVITLGEGSTAIFCDNLIMDKSILRVRGSSINMHNNSQIIFENNTGLICGGMLLVNTTLNFVQGQNLILFSHNRGSTGGAMALYDTSTLEFHCTAAELQFIDNHATDVGGAIYIQDLGYLKHQIFISAFFNANCQYAQFYFINNTAQHAGSTLYGGWIDLLPYTSYPILGNLINDIDHPSLVSSDPTRVCMCTGSTPNCTIMELSVPVYPGQTYSLPAVAVGQKFGTVPSVVEARFNGTRSAGELDELQYAQILGPSCTNLTFTLRSSAKKEKIVILIRLKHFQIETSNLQFLKYFYKGLLIKNFEITFSLMDCPLGFYFNTDKMQCLCQKDILEKSISCDQSTFKIFRPTPKWINATFIHTSNNQPTGVIVHGHCPFDYCILTEGELVVLDLETPDDQCAFNRSGILCGACPIHFSHVLGTSRCKKCPKPWVALIIPMIALAGFILVAFLITLNLTVSVGSISGLIFYANVVRANNAVFFPPGASDSSLNAFSSFFSTFIAWLNLDLGIETCLYDGLTAYGKTWLQFFFPLYIWLLVIIIVVASHYSSTASRLSGKNAVQVLATLFLLSYAKLLRLVITIFSSTELIYPDGYHKRVWLYDGNVDYLTGKHISLFIAALILLIFVSAPYTTVLLFIQCLQKWSSFRVFVWIRKFHPLFDAYTGPYKVKHRYWTGLLLLIRVILSFVFSLNSLGDPTMNLLAVVAVASCLLAYIAIVGGIYKLWPLTVLEIICILNLGILSAAVGFYQEGTGTVVPAITCSSVGICVLIFIAIVFYHFVMKLSKSHRGRALKDLVQRKFLKPKCGDDQELMPQHVMGPVDEFKSMDVTHTVVEISLNEPLLTPPASLNS